MSTLASMDAQQYEKWRDEVEPRILDVAKDKIFQLCWDVATSEIPTKEGVTKQLRDNDVSVAASALYEAILDQIGD